MGANTNMCLSLAMLDSFYCRRSPSICTIRNPAASQSPHETLCLRVLNHNELFFIPSHLNN